MKVGGDQVVLVPRISIFGGDASHGSHRVVAPMDKRLSVMRACAVWLHHQHTVEENLLDRCRQKRRWVFTCSV